MGQWVVEGKYLLSVVLGAEADSCARESQAHSGRVEGFPALLPVTSFLLTGLLGWRVAPGPFPCTQLLAPSAQPIAAWSWLVVSVGVSMGDNGDHPSWEGEPHLWSLLG